MKIEAICEQHSTDARTFLPQPGPGAEPADFEPPLAPMAMPRQRLERRRGVIRLHLAWLARRAQRHP